MEKLVEREDNRRKSMAQWEARWRVKNAALAKQMREQKELEHRKELEFQERERNALDEERRLEELELDQMQVKVFQRSKINTPNACCSD